MTLSMENAAERFNCQLTKGHVTRRDGGLWFDEDAATAITELAINLEEARDEARGLAAAVAELEDDLADQGADLYRRDQLIRALIDAVEDAEEPEEGTLAATLADLLEAAAIWPLVRP